MKYLKQFIHPQWGSVIGSEKEIRLAVLKDELESLASNETHLLPTTEGYIQSRIKELQSSIIIIQEHEMTWGNEYE